MLYRLRYSSTRGYITDHTVHTSREKYLLQFLLGTARLTSVLGKEVIYTASSRHTLARYSWKDHLDTGNAMFSITDPSARFYVPNMPRLSMQSAWPRGTVEFNRVMSAMTFRLPLTPLDEDSHDANILAIIERLGKAKKKCGEFGFNSASYSTSYDIIESHAPQLHPELMQNRFAEAISILLLPPERRSGGERQPGTLRSLRQQWQAEYQGTSLSAFKQILSQNQNLWDSAQDKFYAKSVTIIQSSGVGKSRLISEYAKECFTIIYTLRNEGEMGYPPGDTEVTNFLCIGGKKTIRNAHTKSLALLYGTFEHGR